MMLKGLFLSSLIFGALSARLTRVVLGSAFATVIAGTAAASINIVQNPGFESGAFNNFGSNYDQINSGGTDLSSWTVGASIAWGLNATDGFNAHSGSGWVDLTGVGSNYPSYGTLSQTLSTGTGQHYAFSIFTSILTAGQVTVLVDGTPLSLSGAYGTAPNSWGQLTGNFIATGPSSFLAIEGGGPFSYVIGVDDVSVSAVRGVPEPSVWAMMLLGFAGVGFLMRRDSRRGTFIAE